MESFPLRLALLRKDKKVFQRDMAEYLEVSTRAYQMYENGTNGPGVENLIKLADYFNVSIDYLVGRTDKPDVNR